jgi:hypothetical protein
MNEIHPKFDFLKTTIGMCASLKPLPKPPNVLNASRVLRLKSADDSHPIGASWNLFLTLGLTLQNSSPSPFFIKEASRLFMSLNVLVIFSSMSRPVS